MTHIGIIMDGNRRWAKERFLPALAGHKAWADRVVEIVEYAAKCNIDFLTLWALSTENIKKRSEEEISWIISLINSIEKYLEKMREASLRFRVIGDISQLPGESQEILERVQWKSEKNTWMTLILALNYGWQDEIVRATKKIIAAGINPEDLNETEFKKYLDTADIPAADLIIRTGGDIRHSGFLLYDSAYSEYYFTQKKWPEFDTLEFETALSVLCGAKRNFWK
jgi:undecaprenyl diphosphate synthase